MRLTSKIIHNAPNVICRGTDTLTNTHIFTPDSGISSHSFGRLYSTLVLIYGALRTIGNENKFKVVILGYTSEIFIT